MNTQFTNTGKIYCIDPGYTLHWIEYMDVCCIHIHKVELNIIDIKAYTLRCTTWMPAWICFVLFAMQQPASRKYCSVARIYVHTVNARNTESNIRLQLDTHGHDLSLFKEFVQNFRISFLRITFHQFIFSSITHTTIIHAKTAWVFFPNLSSNEGASNVNRASKNSHRVART